jgi:hypothetical protein
MSEKLVELIKNIIPRVSDLTPFEGTVFDFPLFYGITGSKMPEESKIEKALGSIAGAEGGYFIDALWLAELVESATSDRDEYFMGDDRFRSFCVGLNEGANGWALLLGDDDAGSFTSLSTELKARRLRLFASGSAAVNSESYGVDVKSLGGRETGLIYFAQMLMRYAIIYGRELAGEAHEIAHAVEEYAPGVVFILGKLTDLEALLVQGMLSLRAPVVTLDTDHGLVGHVYVAGSIPEMVELAWSLPNIRARLVEPATPEVPVPTGRVFVREKLAEGDLALELKGSSSSFMVVKPSLDVNEDGIAGQRGRRSPDHPLGRGSVAEAHQPREGRKGHRRGGRRSYTQDDQRGPGSGLHAASPRQPRPNRAEERFPADRASASIFYNGLEGGGEAQSRYPGLH